MIRTQLNYLLDLHCLFSLSTQFAQEKLARYIGTYLSIFELIE